MSRKKNEFSGRTAYLSAQRGRRREWHCSSWTDFSKWDRVISESDVVIATAAVPGKKAPVLISGEMIQGMKEGSVIVDLAAEQGGNCEVTEPGKTVEIGGVVVSGPLNVPSSIPHHSSQMFSKNITNFFQLMVKDGKLITDVEDEIVQESMVTNNGEIVNSQIKETLGL